MKEQALFCSIFYPITSRRLTAPRGSKKMMKKRHDEILEILSSLLVIAVCLSSCLKIEKVVDGASKEVALSPVASVMTKQIPGPVLGTTYSEKLHI